MASKSAFNQEKYKRPETKNLGIQKCKARDWSIDEN